MIPFNRTILKYGGRTVAILPCHYKVLENSSRDFKDWLYSLYKLHNNSVVGLDNPSGIQSKTVGKLSIHGLTDIYFDEIQIETFSYEINNLTESV